MEGWFGAAFLVVGFVILCRVFRLISGVRKVSSVTGEVFAVLGDPVLDDDSKEQAMQRHAIRLFGLFLRLLTGGVAAFAIPLGFLWLAAGAGWVSWEASLRVGLSFSFIFAVTVVSFAGWWLWKRIHSRKGSETDSAETGYSAVDRMLYRIAFATVPVQVGLSGVEDWFYRRRLEGIELERPVFVTGLPRSGTTLILDLCHQSGEFAAHTYRQMPFVLHPLLWRSFSRWFRKDMQLKERAHGDGMQIDADSPEALEEVVWMAFWKAHYGQVSIQPWKADEKAPGFQPFLRRHMIKLIGASNHQQMGSVRYLSKNNLNIARIGWLRQAFPDARFVVPFREPLQHVASLLRQHLNFLQRHQQDVFVREYMTAIGHFDFGANLRPVDFDGWFSAEKKMLHADSENFWLRYWIAAYTALHREAMQSSQIYLLDFDALCAAPGDKLAELEDFLGMAKKGNLVKQAGCLHPLRIHLTAPGTVDAGLLEEAIDLHRRLVGLACLS